jgi:uncharacterized protein
MLHIHPLRLKPGEDLRKSIVAYAQQHQLQAACILTCVGSLTQFNIRYADKPSGSNGSGHFEIVSLVGTVSIHGSHIHISIADENGHMIGGHLLDECLVYTTAEIVLGESSTHIFNREKDGTTAWEELQIRTRN